MKCDRQRNTTFFCLALSCKACFQFLEYEYLWVYIWHYSRKTLRLFNSKRENWVSIWRDKILLLCSSSVMFCVSSKLSQWVISKKRFHAWFTRHLSLVLADLSVKERNIVNCETELITISNCGEISLHNIYLLVYLFVKLLLSSPNSLKVIIYFHWHHWNI